MYHVKGGNLLLEKLGFGVGMRMFWEHRLDELGDGDMLHLFSVPDTPHTA